MVRRRLSRILLAALILPAAVSAYVFFGLYILIGLIALNVLFAVLAPMARKRGWRSEGRLTTHLSHRSGTKATAQTRPLPFSNQAIRGRNRPAPDSTPEEGGDIVGRPTWSG
jgi:hypothetical protein